MLPDRPSRRPPSGFTLLELLVVISLLGVIMAIAAPSVAGAGRRSMLLAQAHEIANRIGAARELAMAKGRCVLLHVDGSAPASRKKLEVAVLNQATFDCERDATDGAGTIGIRYDGSEAALEEVKSLEYTIASDRPHEMSVIVSNSEPVLVFRPTGWVRGDNRGSRSSFTLANDNWRLTLTDPSLTGVPNTMQIVVAPQGLICVLAAGSASCP